MTLPSGVRSSFFKDTDFPRMPASVISELGIPPGAPSGFVTIEIEGIRREIELDLSWTRPHFEPQPSIDKIDALPLSYL